MVFLPFLRPLVRAETCVVLILRYRECKACFCFVRKEALGVENGLGINFHTLRKVLGRGKFLTAPGLPNHPTPPKPSYNWPNLILAILGLDLCFCFARKGALWAENVPGIDVDVYQVCGGIG